MNPTRGLTSKEKALQINLDEGIYGSFAEIGAGQEIAAQFFKAGGASGTIAKTMSAYDMAFSDAIYGKTKRYVCRERLTKMLDHEYGLLEERLGSKSEDTKFFAIANTIETLNYQKSNRGHGWIGMRFQLSPNQAANECILHVMLHDHDMIMQQQTVGIIGVNLIFAAYYAHDSIDQFLATLMEGLSRDRVEFDMLSISGPDFDWDDRLVSLKLVKSEMTDAAMFGPDGRVMQPSEVLYKKNILMMRGRFRPPTLVNEHMFESGKKQFLAEQDVDEKKVAVFAELTLNDLRQDGVIDEQDYLDRADILCKLGYKVLISNYQRYYCLVSYLSQFNKKHKIGLLLGIRSLESIFDESYYKNLRGGILEAFGVLFGTNVKLYVYPSLQDYSNQLYSCRQIQLPFELQHLYHYLFTTNKIEDIRRVDPELLHITSDEVLKMIKEGIEGWETLVPPGVASQIKANGLFGHPVEDKVSATA